MQITKTNERERRKYKVKAFKCKVEAFYPGIIPTLQDKLLWKMFQTTIFWSVILHFFHIWLFPMVIEKLFSIFLTLMISLNDLLKYKILSLKE